MSSTAEISEWLKNVSERKIEEHYLAVSHGENRSFLTDYISLKKINFKQHNKEIEKD